MTAKVEQILAKIGNNSIFEDELYFVGGTALSYYLRHRISEDIDITSVETLKYKQIISSFIALGAVKITDENAVALRLAGMFADEYMIKFILENVKIEFFQANRAIQKEILSQSTFSSFENSKLKILDIKSVAKLKLVALIMREKSRDLFDFSAIIEHGILSKNEIIEIFSKVNNKIATISDVVAFIKSKKESQDDEAVYITEVNRVDLTFSEIKEQAIDKLMLNYGENRCS